MARGNTGLDSHEYDDWLAKNRKEREIKQRQAEKRNRGCKGWHFGCSDKPFFAKDKNDFKKQLDERGLMLKDDVRRRLK